jgi:erythromycin esterase-like protein
MITEFKINWEAKALIKKGMTEQDARQAAIALLEERAAAKAVADAASAERIAANEAARLEKEAARNTPEMRAKRLAKMNADQQIADQHEAFLAALSEEDKIEYYEFIQRQSVMRQRGIQIPTPAKFNF